MRRHGFSLVELSIILVILGLLTGGILAGQSLIRASELRSVTVEYNRYITAAQAFRDKYFALAGDMSNATTVWGRLSTSGCRTNSSAAVVTNGVCDGDANGQLVHDGYSSEPNEFWRELALAGLIEGNYTGIPGANGQYDSNPGSNVPQSKISNTGWTMNYFDNTGHSSAYNYDINYGNALQFGAYAGGSTTVANLKPAEAWNIDTKMDDGFPASGKLYARYWNNQCATNNSGTIAATNFDDSYRLSDGTLQCSLVFKTGL